MSATENRLLGLTAETAIHAGTGQSTGVIDLPIQREGHSGWPCIFGSGVKGALRSRAEDLPGISRDTINLVFGPDTQHASDHAGALAVSDARLLLLPVRALTSHFKWVTCPALLARLARDAARVGIGGFQALASVPVDDPGEGFAALQQGADAELFLEEYRFSAKQTDLIKVIDCLAQFSPRPGFATQLKQQLTVVSNDSFAHLSQHATPVNAHVAIDSATKTVRNGALWYEETLPPDTLLYTILSAANARAAEADMPASAVLDAIVSQLFGERPYLQIGGNETVGMGWCAVTVIDRPRDQATANSEAA